MGHIGVNNGSYRGQPWVIWVLWVMCGSHNGLTMGHILAFLMKTLLVPMTSIIICHGELMKVLTKKLLAKKF